MLFLILLNKVFSLKLRTILNLALRLQTLHITHACTFHSLTMELPVLENHQQISTKIIKSQDENKNRSNEFHEFIHFIPILMGPIYIF